MTDTGAPTRKQLLDLPHGERITRGNMSAYRQMPSPLEYSLGRDPRRIIFSKHYLEGKLVWSMSDEAVEDLLADPWTLAEQLLDEQAQREGAHHRDGSDMQRPTDTLAPTHSSTAKGTRTVEYAWEITYTNGPSSAKIVASHIEIDEVSYELLDASDHVVWSAPIGNIRNITRGVAFIPPAAEEAPST